MWDFKMTGKTLVVSETQNSSGGERVLQLLPHTLFKGELQQELVSGYSHWYCAAEKIVEFRKLGFTDPDFPNPVYLARLHQGSAKLVSNITQRQLLCMHGTLFCNLMQVFQRLDLPTHVFMYLNDTGHKPSVVIHLSKLGLDFEASEDEIHSVQFLDYVVGVDQYIGTLLPFKNMLQLSNKATNAKLVLVPAMRLLLDDGTVVADLGTEHRLSPPFFSYDVDDVLRKLKPALPLAALYLSYLHAATSYHFPDPFTGLTGTESAMMYLKNYNTNIAYDAASQQVLDMIRRLSPTRSAYPERLNFYGVVSWPDTLVPQAASDALKLQTTKMLKFHARLSFLYNTKSTEINESTLDLDLCKVAYRREAYKYSPAARLTELETKKNTLVVLSLVPQPALRAITKVVWMGLARGTSNMSFVPDKFLLQHQTVSGCQEIQNSIQSWKTVFYPGGNLVKPQDVMLSLYQKATARNVRETTSECALLAWLWKYAKTEVPSGFFEFIIRVSFQPKDIDLPAPPKFSKFAQPAVTYSKTTIKECVEKAHPRASDAEVKQILLRVSNSNVWSLTLGRVRSKHPAKESCLTTGSDAHVYQLLAPHYKSWRANALLQHFLLALEDTVVDVGVFIDKREIPDFSPVEPPVLPRQPFVPFSKPFAQAFHSLEPRYEEIARLGRDSEIEVLFQKCLSGSVGRSRGEISAEIAAKTKDIAILDSLEFDDDDSYKANEERRRMLYKERKCLSDELKNCSAPDTSAPFPFSYVENTGDFARPMGEDILRSLKESWAAQCDQNKPTHTVAPDARENLLAIEQMATKHANSLWRKLCSAFRPPASQLCQLAAQFAGLCTPLVPTLVLASLLDTKVPAPVKRLIIAFTTFKLYLLKVRRCLHYLETGSKNHLLKEFSQLHAEGWSVEQYPQWLLFEVEQGIFIRTIQAKIAIQIIESKESICLQLQMGEGKTSVILPIVCSVLSDKNRVARINVIPSLLETSTSNLTMALGGMLHHTIFQFPFSRSVKADEDTMNKILYQLEDECMPRKGIIVTVSEHRLSFELQWELKLKNSLANPELRAAAKSMEYIIQWWHDNVVDILDESDEQLRHKYQLIYPIGTQQQVDGGKQRWLLPEEIMLLLQKNVRQLAIKLGQNSIEYFGSKNAEWAQIRMLSETHGRHASDVLAEEILSGQVKLMKYFSTLNSQQHEMVRKYITQGDMPPKERYEVEMIPVLKEHKAELLILRGFFAYDLLSHVLTKRWNVDYGVREGGPGRVTRVAVPYRAKDTPSERSEYGHPDVSICTTLISYYYHGLKYEEFVEVMKFLNSHPSKEEEYSSWVEMHGDILPEYRDHTCVNLADCVLMRELHELFAKNMCTVNSYLKNLVFPTETKQFEEKLTASSWHIVQPKKFPTCGFSGTKDSYVLLPINITQKDLPSLKHIDCEVMKFLLDQKGPCVHNSPDNQLQGKDLLLHLVNCSHKPRVLIDVGALLVSLSNKEVAEIWLNSTNPTEIRGAIFFDKDNRLTAMNRSGHCTDFFLSPFNKQMDSVITYLDDHHTRGTDLKFPINTHAVATLSVKLPKEKLVQACMRMRQLGQGHTVCFFPSHEVHIALTKDARKEISVHDVLLWSIKNTITMLENSMQQWATQGFAYARTNLAVKYKDNLPFFAKLIALSEYATLKELYDLSRKETTGTAVVHRLHDLHNDKVRKTLDDTDTSRDIYKTEYTPLMTKINERVAKYLSDFTTYSNAFDEEQERELEQEVEEERESHKPPPHKPHKASVSEPLTKAIQEHPSQLIDLPLREAFKNTSLYDLAYKDPEAFDKRIRVTNDFIHTVQPEGKENLDMFLRRPNCAIVFWEQEATENQGHNVQQIVLVSQHEATELLPKIRLSSSVSLHHVNVRSSTPTELLLSPLHTPQRSTADLQNLRPLAVQISLIAGSKCFAGYPLFEELMDDLYSFLGVCPYPYQGVKEPQDMWRRLRDENVIDENGWIKSAETPASLHPTLAPFFEKCAHRFSKASPLEFLKKNAQKRYSEFSI